MRDLKFRQFYNGRMEVVGFLTENGCEFFRGFPNSNRDKYPVMQYTGLKDKNGVEIYEGDIVSFGEDDINTPRCGMYGEIGVVKYSPYDAEFKVELLSSGRFVTLAEHLLFSDKHVCRIVIGNIHQNPELLGDI